MAFRIILDLGNGEDRNIGAPIHKTLGEARAALITGLSRPAIEYSGFAVLEAERDHTQHARNIATAYLHAIEKVFDLQVGEQLPIPRDQFYYIEEVPDRE